jgi:hypothetical protein
MTLKSTAVHQCVDKSQGFAAEKFSLVPRASQSRLARRANSDTPTLLSNPRLFSSRLLLIFLFSRPDHSPLLSRNGFPRSRSRRPKGCQTRTTPQASHHRSAHDLEQLAQTRQLAQRLLHRRHPSGRMHRFHMDAPAPANRCLGRPVLLLHRHGCVSQTVFRLDADPPGITAGYHRLWAHKSYLATRPLELFLALFGGGAIEGSIRWWSRDQYVGSDFGACLTRAAVPTTATPTPPRTPTASERASSTPTSDGWS